MNTDTAIRSTLSTATLAAALILLGWAAEAQSLRDVGGVNMVRIWASGTPPAQTKRELNVDLRVYHEESVETVRDGALHITFLDGSKFRMGSNSKAALDRFTFDPDKGTGELTISVSKGIFRFVSGQLKGPKTIRTPTADISLRGTIVTIFVALNGATFVSVLEGTALMTALSDRSAIVVQPGGNNGQVQTDGSAEPYAGEVGAGDAGIEAGEGFETESTVQTENTGTGQGDTQTMQKSSSSGQTPAALSPLAVFAGATQTALSTTVTGGTVEAAADGGSTGTGIDPESSTDGTAETTTDADIAANAAAAAADAAKAAAAAMAAAADAAAAATNAAAAAANAANADDAGKAAAASAAAAAADAAAAAAIAAMNANAEADAAAAAAASVAADAAATAGGTAAATAAAGAAAAATAASNAGGASADAGAAAAAAAAAATVPDAAAAATAAADADAAAATAADAAADAAAAAGVAAAAADDAVGAAATAAAAANDAAEALVRAMNQPPIASPPSTMMFEGGVGTPLRYSEAGMTVTSLQTHLHFEAQNGNIGLLNHTGCCSTPYRFELDSGGTFDLVSFEQIRGGANDVWTSSTGGAFSPTGTGLQTLPTAGFTKIESVEWDAGSTSTIDDLKFVAQPAPGS